MTVAAVLLAASPDRALADAAGVPRIRRIAAAAWSGGATPIIVVVPDPDGTVALALSGASVSMVEPVAVEAGPVGQIVRGIEAAVDEISATAAVLIWPARMCWVGPETVTSLVEAHGLHPNSVIRPTYHGTPGWPVLMPLAAASTLRDLSPVAMPDELIASLIAIGIPDLTLDLGDPGTVVDGDTDRSALPAYEGPGEPSRTPEWGAVVAATPDDAPLESPPTAGS
ncbi:MAG: NTP transferase domain-containing protein [Chloroflexota bacterium]